MIFCFKTLSAVPTYVRRQKEGKVLHQVRGLLTDLPIYQCDWASRACLVHLAEKFSWSINTFVVRQSPARCVVVGARFRKDKGLQDG